MTVAADRFCHGAHIARSSRSRQAEIPGCMAGYQIRPRIVPRTVTGVCSSIP